MGKLTMSIKESNQLGILERLKKGEITQLAAAKQLGITDRQVRNKLKRFTREGAKGIVHKLRGKPSNNGFDPALKEQILKLIRDHYSDFGPTLATEYLLDRHGIKITRETLRSFMVKGGIWQVRKQRIHHHKWRERRACFGQLVLFDGSEHAWLEDRSPVSTLLLYIDDATSNILWGAFTNGESTRNVMLVSQEYFVRYGLPEEVYTDRGCVYKVNVHNPDNEQVTQFGRALAELNINLIHALSPQAKGRIERCFKTLQDRLIKELRFANISTLEEANHYLQNVYIPRHNTKFAVRARQENNAHRPIPDHLNDILCTKSVRILQNDFTMSYCNRIFQLHDQQQAFLKPKESITVLEHLDGTIKLSVRKISLNFDEISHKKILIKKPVNTDKRVNNRANASHPWRKGYQNLSDGHLRNY
jgi:DNA-binding Lrp family transcriptional regulator